MDLPCEVAVGVALLPDDLSATRLGGGGGEASLKGGLGPGGTRNTKYITTNY